MRLNPAAFNAWLSGNIGQQFTWAQAYSCPCVTANSGAANQNCKVCSGRGQLWAAPVPAKSGVASQKVQQDWAILGLWKQGDIVLSIPSDSPMYAAGRFDRLVDQNATEKFSVVNLVHGTFDQLFIPVVSISRVFWVNQALTATIEGSIPAIDSAGNLTWPSGGAPPNGQTYSVTGVQYQEFYVFMDYPQNRNEHFGSALPRKLIARRFDLFGR